MNKYKIFILTFVLSLSIILVGSYLGIKRQQQEAVSSLLINQSVDNTTNSAQTSSNQTVSLLVSKLNQTAQPETVFSFGPGYYDFTLEYDGLERSYIIYAPVLYDKAMPTPVVLNFHGGGGSAEGHQSLSGMNSTADKHGFIVVYPRGMRTDGSPSRQFQRFWNPGNSYYSNQFLNSLNDVGFTEKVLDDIETKFNIDKKRVYATGFSNGAALVNLLGCKLSDRLAAIAPVAAPMWNRPDDCNPTRSVSVMYFHGTQDTCAPYSGGLSECEAGIGGFGRVFISAEQSVSIWREKNGCLAQEQTIYKNNKAVCQAFSCRQDSEVVLCTIDGGGHTWPSGQPYALPGLNIGTTTTDISANEAMWQFFQKHPLF